MLQVHDLHKSYAARPVVSGVSLSAAPGQIIGLLGPNGAGKTTTVSMICGLTKADSGSVLLAGQHIDADDSETKRKIGLVPQDIALYENLSAIGNLHTFGALYGLRGPLLRERSLAALELVGLSERAKDKPEAFSGGMKRRLNIACALVHDPDILLLDEPTVGIDPQSRNAIFDNLETLKARGKTMIYTTHYMEEAERLCDRIVIMDHGKVIANDTLAGLYRQLPASATLEIELDGDVDTETLKRQPGVQTASLENGRLCVSVESLADSASSVLAWLASQGHRVNRISSGRANLETLFLALTGRQLRD
ncbi:MAG: ABC transporter ATP-binding protein [Usitatibacteraceae bacterium]